MSFELFPRLPVEIRYKIWDEACCGPRIVDISADTFKGDESAFFGERLAAGVESATISFGSQFNCHPSILYVSHEARFIGLKHYTLDFGTELEFDEEVYGTKMHIRIKVDPKIYMNWSCDIVCLVHNLQNVRERTANNILHNLLDYLVNKPLRRLAIGSVFINDWDEPQFASLCEILANHSGVEVILYEDWAELRKFPILHPTNKKFPPLHPTPGGITPWADLVESRTSAPSLQLTVEKPRYYDCQTRRHYGFNLSLLDSALKFLEDGIREARRKRPELEELSLPKITPMTMIMVPGCISSILGHDN